MGKIMKKCWLKLFVCSNNQQREGIRWRNTVWPNVISSVEERKSILKELLKCIKNLRITETMKQLMLSEHVICTQSERMKILKWPFGYLKKQQRPEIPWHSIILQLAI